MPTIRRFLFQSITICSCWKRFSRIRYPAYCMEANNAYLEGKKLKFGNKMNFYTHEAQQILLDDSLFDLPYFTGCRQAMVFAASKQMVIFFHVFS